MVAGVEVLCNCPVFLLLFDCMMDVLFVLNILILFSLTDYNELSLVGGN